MPVSIYTSRQVAAAEFEIQTHGICFRHFEPGESGDDAASILACMPPACARRSLEAHAHTHTTRGAEGCCLSTRRRALPVSQSRCLIYELTVLRAPPATAPLSCEGAPALLLTAELMSPRAGRRRSFILCGALPSRGSLPAPMPASAAVLLPGFAIDRSRSIDRFVVAR